MLEIKFVRANKSERERGIHQVVVNAEGLALGRMERDWPPYSKRYYGFVGYHPEEPAEQWRHSWLCSLKLEEAISRRPPSPQPEANPSWRIQS